MHKNLIKLAFAKGKESRMEIGHKKPSLTSIAKDISDFIDEKVGFRLGERTFRNYLNYSENCELEEDITIIQLDVINGLCKYLGYIDYPNFISEKHKINGNNKERGKGMRETPLNNIGEYFSKKQSCSVYFSNKYIQYVPNYFFKQG